MAQGQVLVTRDSMLQALNRFNQSIVTLQNIRRQVDASVVGLIGPSWGGSTANRFALAMREWDEQYQIVQRALGAMTENLAANTGSYDAGDESAQQQTVALSGAISG